MLLVLVADDEGAADLLQNCMIKSQRIEGSMKFYCLTYLEIPFVLVISGYGKVNIARALTLAFHFYCISSLLCIGIAGVLYQCGYFLNHAVIAHSTFQYDVDFTPLGNSLGTFPKTESGVFMASPELVNYAVLAANTLSTPYHIGSIASADSFIADGQKAELLRQKFDAFAVDAETGAFAETAILAGLPFVSVKVLCHSADLRSPEQYVAHSAYAIQRAWSLALAFLQVMNEKKAAP